MLLIKSDDLQNVDLNFCVYIGFDPDENCLYEVEDMVLNDHQMYEMFGTGFNDSGRRWPNGQLPYRFDASIEEDEINITIAVIERFNKAMNGCLEIM